VGRWSQKIGIPRSQIHFSPATKNANQEDRKNKNKGLLPHEFKCANY
jgi:hypothetical protein